MVGKDYVPFIKAVALNLYLSFDGLSHGSEMDGNMGGIGDKISASVKDGIGKVQPFFDVSGNGGLLEGAPHLLAYGHEEIAENGEEERVAGGTALL